MHEPITPNFIFDLFLPSPLSCFGFLDKIISKSCLNLISSSGLKFKSPFLREFKILSASANIFSSNC